MHGLAWTAAVFRATSRPCCDHAADEPCPGALSRPPSHAPQRTATAVLPLREGEQRMKEYLLEAGGRAALLAQQGGRLEAAPRGVLGLEPLLQARCSGGRGAPLPWQACAGEGGCMAGCLVLAACPPPLPPRLLRMAPFGLMQDRSFACLHYRLDSEGRLHPVSTATGPRPAQSAAGSASPAAASGSAAAAGPAAAAAPSGCGIERSDVQLGVMVRKGVGGTCPLR